LADAEVLMLLLACVSDLKLDLQLTNVDVLLGDAGLTRSLLDSLPRRRCERQVRDAIARLDRVQLETLELETDLRHCLRDRSP
jgi:ATP phosphoribosyltransferase regulatory subunit HisZ